MKRILLYSNLLLILSCNSHHNKKGIELAMEQYDHLIKKMDTDSIALLYTPDGDLGGRAIGRDSIKKFLATFKNFRVLSQSSATTSIELHAGTSTQRGKYRQIVITPGNDTVTVTGEYTATWQWIPKEGWHIKRMTTKAGN